MLIGIPVALFSTDWLNRGCLSKVFSKVFMQCLHCDQSDTFDNGSNLSVLILVQTLHEPFHEPGQAVHTALEHVLELIQTPFEFF